MEDDLHFFKNPSPKPKPNYSRLPKMEDNFNLSKIENDLSFSKMEDDLHFFKNGR
jgi:hypothetical protein